MLQSLLNKNPLFVFALETESMQLFPENQTIHTGIGKVNATYALTKRIMQDKPSIIVNLGSAGSSTFPKGSVVCCTKFIQRDMDASAIGVEKYITPFSSNNSSILEYGLAVSFLPNGICGSGDSFVINHNSTDYNIIDMEAYALAQIAQYENIPFLCLKYISDGANDQAGSDWNNEVNEAAKALDNTIHRIQENEEVLYF